MSVTKRKKPSVEQIVDELPFGNYINVAKHVTYDVNRIIEHIIEERPNDELTMDDFAELVVKCVENYAKDDFSCGWGHEVHLKDLVFTDEHGEEL